MIDTIILIMLLLIVKHFIVDLPAQTPYQWMNKGIYGHPGGLLHAGLHGATTFGVLVFFVVAPYALFLGVLDAIVHYHIDWAKMNINKHYGWTADKNPEFWWLLGLDQFLHYFTYIVILLMLV